ncbi:MAG: fimbrial biogenesis chaperone [Aeromonas veronii]
MASVVLNSTRYIYEMGKKNISFVAQNNHDVSFLTQVNILSGEGDDSVPFLVTPPLIKINEKSSQLFKVTYLGDVSKTKNDRETLYWLDVLAVPPMRKENESKNVINVAVKTRVKFFLRPEGLKVSTNEIPNNLKWFSENGSLFIENKSPYYVTLSSGLTFTCGNNVYEKEINQTDMLRPLQVSGIIKGFTGLGCNVQYSYIDDFGALRTAVGKVN